MAARQLVSTHISSLWPPSQITPHPVHTTRKNVPLASSSTSPTSNPEHACQSITFYTAETGNILMRVLHDGLMLELISLSADIAPLRFVFPSPILPTPAIFLEKNEELHIIAVTKSASLYRLVVTIGSRFRLWMERVQEPWYTEHLIVQAGEKLSGVVDVQHPTSVVLGLPNGSLLRIDSDSVNGRYQDEHWTESLSSQSSLFSTFSSFFPHKGTVSSQETEILAIATLEWPTDVLYTWTLSKDRGVRVWRPKHGCVTTKLLNTISSEQSPPPSRGSVPPLSMPTSGGPQKWLRAFTQDGNIHLMAFNPSTQSSSFAGSFHLFLSEGDQLNQLAALDCSASSSGCHLQDFLVEGNRLTVLWDNRGQSLVETTYIDFEQLMGGEVDLNWKRISYAVEPEYTPALLEQLFLSPGSLTEKFLEAIFVPGVFSLLTLRTALQQYIDTNISLPGPHGSSLIKAFTSLPEHIGAVVGSSINLLADPHTGALQYTDYFVALKRDWEGFIARCREVERGARWPLSLGLDEENEVIVMERERVGYVTLEDTALTLQRQLASGEEVGEEHELLNVLWSLKEKMGVSLVADLEHRVVDIVRQEIAYSLAEVLGDQAKSSRIADTLEEEGVTAWIDGRLQRVDNINEAMHTLIDVVGAFEGEVKQEEEEVNALMLPPRSSWQLALTAAYVCTSINARYEIALCLVLYTFFASDELSQWDPTLLEEIYALFRGVAMLRAAARLPVSEGSAPQDPHQLDEMVHRLRNLHVTHLDASSTHIQPLIFQLVSQTRDNSKFSVSALRFLDNIGLLRSISCAHATIFEISFCERLFHLGHLEIMRSMLDWLPRTPAATFLRARQLLSVGRADHAACLLEQIAGCFGESTALSADDQNSIASILPNRSPFASDFAFYIYSASLFKQASYVEQEVSFSKLAISVAPSEADTLTLWQNVIKGCIELTLYDEAYTAITSTPHEGLKRDFVSMLVYRMCENDAVGKLMEFNFATLADEVQECLAFKARTAEPLSRPSYSRILYTWYVQRGDYRNAASVMFQRARKLRELLADPSSIHLVAQQQLEAYLAAINALNVVDRKAAYIVTPVVLDSPNEPRKRRRLDNGGTETVQGNATEIVDVAAMEYEYTLLSARLQLALRTSDPHDFLLPPESIVLRLAQLNRFDSALSIGRSLKVDMTDAFAHLTSRCLLLDRDAAAVMEEDTSDWLLTDKISSWPGTPADRGWRYLRQALQRHDTVDTDFNYSKTTLETILTYDSSWPIPPWLINFLEEKHPEFLIRISLRFELFETAIQHSLTMLRKADERISQDLHKRDSSTWLPYSLIDQVLVVTAEDEGVSSTAKDLRQQLQTELAARVKRMHKFSQFKK